MRLDSFATSVDESFGYIRNVAHQLGCVLEIPVGIADVAVSHVGAEREHVLSDATAAIWARLKRSYSKSMAEIHKSRCARDGPFRYSARSNYPPKNALRTAFR